jgi:predicted ATP-dependent serine protease
MQHVYNEGPVKGSRNMKLMRMASSYKRSGVPYLVALNGLLTWANGTLPDNEVIRSVSNTYEGNYVYSCKDHIMAEYCDPKCVYFKNKDYVLEINSIDILEQNLRNYINEDLTERSIDVGNMFDMQSYNFKPGELVVFSGDTGMGKSAFVQYVVTKAMKNVLYLSLEMKEELTFRRFGQMAIGQTQEWINNKYKTDPDFTLKDKLEHIQLMTIAPRIDSIKKIVAEYQPNVLVIDTADEVQVDFNRGEIEKQNIVIDGLKQIAQKNNIIIIAVSHLNKTSAASNVVALHSLKGSSNLVQKADKVLVIKGERTEKVRTISSEKSRDEDRFEMTVFFNTDNFTFRKLNES